MTLSAYNDGKQKNDEKIENGGLSAVFVWIKSGK